MKKKILILGGTGFIGTHLCNVCLKKKLNVTILSRKKPKIKKKNITYISCDLTDKRKLKRIFSGKTYDYIVNLSGNIDHSIKKQTYRIHYNGCKNIVDIFKNKNINKFIQIGTCLEYGKSLVPHYESYKAKFLDLKSSYSRAKLKATEYLIKTNKKYNFPFVVLRLYQIYGPGQNYNRLIPFVIRSCLDNKKFNCSDGLQKKDFLYVSDLIDVIITVLFKKKLIEKIINVGSGRAIEIREIINNIKKLIGTGVPIYGKVKMRIDEPNILYPNLALIKKFLKWKKKVSLESGLLKTINYYRNI